MDGEEQPPAEVAAQEVAAEQMDPAQMDMDAMDGEMGEGEAMEGDAMEGEGDMDDMAGSGMDMEMEPAQEEVKSDNYAADPSKYNFCPIRALSFAVTSFTFIEVLFAGGELYKITVNFDVFMKFNLLTDLKCRILAIEYNFEFHSNNALSILGIKWMTASLDGLEAFSPDGGYLTNDKLQKFNEFINNADYTKFFCWIELGSGVLSWSFDRAPKFYGKYNFILLV